MNLKHSSLMILLRTLKKNNYQIGVLTEHENVIVLVGYTVLRTHLFLFLCYFQMVGIDLLEHWHPCFKTQHIYVLLACCI